MQSVIAAGKEDQRPESLGRAPPPPGGLLIVPEQSPTAPNLRIEAVPFTGAIDGRGRAAARLALPGAPAPGSPPYTPADDALCPSTGRRRRFTEPRLAINDVVTAALAGEPDAAPERRAQAAAMASRQGRCYAFDLLYAEPGQVDLHWDVDDGRPELLRFDAEGRRLALSGPVRDL